MWFLSAVKPLLIFKLKNNNNNKASLWPDVTSDTCDWWVTSHLLGRVEISSSGGHSAPQCLTCNLKPDRCQFSFAYFSSNASFYRVDCYGQLNAALKSSEAIDRVVGAEELQRSLWRHDVQSQEFCNLFSCFCLFLSMPGPGLPLFTLMDKNGKGAFSKVFCFVCFKWTYMYIYKYEIFISTL